MRVKHIASGPPANESESKAISHLINRIQSQPGSGEWILLSNLMFSVNPQQQSDELDIVVIGPSGVKLIEVKHWNTSWIRNHSDIVRNEADRLTLKARKIGTTLRRDIFHLKFVEGTFLLTGEPIDEQQLHALQVGGVSFHKLNEWQSVINLNNPPILDDIQIRRCSKLLNPIAGVALEGNLLRLGHIINLELLTPKEERFHRVYKGVHALQKNRVILHLYDLSAKSDIQAENMARREFEALHALQQYQWAPRILDSFQDAPGFLGEMFFFSVVDRAAPTLEERKTDLSWNSQQRAEFAKNSLSALSEMHGHQFEDSSSPIIHRNITPQTLLVRSDNFPIITGCHLMRIPSEYSISPFIPLIDREPTVAPETIEKGLAAADQRSDIYSICAALRTAFIAQDDMDSIRCYELLSKGMTKSPQERCSLSELKSGFAKILGETVPLPAAPPARFWSEDLVIKFRDRDYRIISRLGSGGVGSTFKVIEMDRVTKEDLGAFVAKTVHTREQGQDAIKAYSLVRSHLGRQQGLSAIYEVAKEWQGNNFVALMSWIEGSSLSDFIGIFPLLAEDLKESSAEDLAIRWICQLCEALETIHNAGLIHGDVSPRNIIVSNRDVILTDYDFVKKIGDTSFKSATELYSSPSLPEISAAPTDDIYALAASFFHVVFEKEPFRYNGNRIKESGLNWDGIEKTICTRIAVFLDKATHPDKDQRYKSAAEVIADLRVCRITEDDSEQVNTQPGQMAYVGEVNTFNGMDNQSIDLPSQPPPDEYATINGIHIPLNKQPNAKIECKVCHKIIKISYKYCPFCTYPTRNLCVKCNNEIDDSYESCPECRTKIKRYGSKETEFLKHVSCAMTLSESKGEKCPICEAESIFTDVDMDDETGNCFPIYKHTCNCRSELTKLQKNGSINDPSAYKFIQFYEKINKANLLDYYPAVTQ